MRNNVRAANAADFDFVKNCWTECFDDDERYVNWNFSENYSAANTLVAECCGESAAAMQCIPYTLSFEKADIAGSGDTIASAPDTVKAAVRPQVRPTRKIQR